MARTTVRELRGVIEAKDKQVEELKDVNLVLQRDFSELQRETRKVREERDFLRTWADRLTKYLAGHN